MGENKDDKCCDNCKHFCRHYSWTGNGFCAVNCGHCACEKRPVRERLNYSYVTSCRFWEDGEEVNAERNKSILKAVKNMSDRLDEIAVIFDKD